MNSILLKNVTGVQSAPSAGVLPQGSEAVVSSPGYSSSAKNAPNQAFQLIVTGTSGNVSATAQIMASNDGNNWVTYGSPIVASAAASPNSASATGSGPFGYFTAYITAISGTGAKATVLMGH